MKSLWIIAVCLLASVGCSLSEQQHHWTARRTAKAAWQQASHGECFGPHARHIERGWRSGYYDVACGGDGRPPLLPPEEYWSFQYQNPEGQQIVQTWFEAYERGALAAERDGVRQWNYVVLAPRGTPKPSEPIESAPAAEAWELLSPAPAGANMETRGTMVPPPRRLPPLDDRTLPSPSQP